MHAAVTQRWFPPARAGPGAVRLPSARRAGRGTWGATCVGRQGGRTRAAPRGQRPQVPQPRKRAAAARRGPRRPPKAPPRVTAQGEPYSAARGALRPRPTPARRGGAPRAATQRRTLRRCARRAPPRAARARAAGVLTAANSPRRRSTLARRAPQRVPRRRRPPRARVARCTAVERVCAVRRGTHHAQRAARTSGATAAPARPRAGGAGRRARSRRRRARRRRVRPGALRCTTRAHGAARPRATHAHAAGACLMRAGLPPTVFSTGRLQVARWATKTAATLRGQAGGRQPHEEGAARSSRRLYCGAAAARCTHVAATSLSRCVLAPVPPRQRNERRVTVLRRAVARCGATATVCSARRGIGVEQ
jgi:hypothetical protein